MMAHQRIYFFTLVMLFSFISTAWAQDSTATPPPPPPPVETQQGLMINVAAGNTNALIRALVRANETCVNQPESAAVTIRLAPQSRYEIAEAHNDGVGANGLPQIDCAITIEGNDSVIHRSGSENYRFFQVNRYNAHTQMGGFLTLHNLTLTNGRASHAGGGAILIQMGRVVLDNVILRQNSTNFSDAFGGAIYNFKGRLEIYDSILADNHANDASTNWRGGGAIGFDGGQGAYLGAATFIINSTLSNNTTDGAGGGIFAYYDTNLHIESTEIIENIGAIGGGIYKVGGGSTTLAATHLIGNLSTQAHTGGGIHIEGSSSIRFQDAMCIVGNQPLGIVNATQAIIDASQIWWGHSTGANGVGDSVTSAINTENPLTTAPEGCLTLIAELPQANAASLIIINSNFTDNQARQGGAIASNNASLYIEGVNFTNNQAEAEGGAIYFIEAQP